MPYSSEVNKYFSRKLLRFKLVILIENAFFRCVRWIGILNNGFAAAVSACLKMTINCYFFVIHMLMDDSCLYRYLLQPVITYTNFTAKRDKMAYHSGDCFCYT